MDDEPAPPSRRSKWLPVTVLAAGTVLIAAPLIYLWRVGKPQRVSLRSAAAAPPRRLGALPASTAAPSRFTFPAPEFPLDKPAAAPPPPAPARGSDWDDDGDWSVPPAPPDPNDNFNAGLYTFKAFGAATLIVGSLAFSGIWGVRVYLQADTMEDFGAKMRLAVMDRMPLLAQRMRNALRPAAPAEDREAPSPDRPWDWDDAQARLTEAYDKGGLGAWADAAVREVEAEAQLEVQTREDLKKFGPKKTA
ncbi:hypothetical protein FB451DRAFT_1409991 [Mycena latifolia]|nr:hypothetical protein FB451DRAFT_1409991 [Mycena latifolia]